MAPLERALHLPSPLSRGDMAPIRPSEKLAGAASIYCFATEFRAFAKHYTRHSGATSSRYLQLKTAKNIPRMSLACFGHFHVLWDRLDLQHEGKERDTARVGLSQKKKWWQPVSVSVSHH